MMGANICLVCRDPQKRGGQEPEPQCFELAPIATGQQQAMFDKAVANTSSTLQTIEATENGKQTSTLYRLTAEGSPVTTKTVAALCGGLAPYIWSPKQLSIDDPASGQKEPFTAAFVTTADGAIYSWNVGEKDFEALGTKDIYRAFKPYEEKLEAQLTKEIDDWFQSGGFGCYVGEVQNRFSQGAGTLIDAIQKTFLPEEPVPPTQIQACRDMVNNAGPVARELEEQLQNSRRALAPKYVAGDDNVLSFAFCPWQTSAALASYDNASRGIYFYLDLFQSPQHLLAATQDQRRFERVVAAHEIGHYRHMREAGVSEQTGYQWVGSFGLPVTIAVTIGDIFEKKGLPAQCLSDFVGAVREKHRLSAPASSWHIPSHTEFIATLYGLDQALSEGNWPWLKTQADNIYREFGHITETLGTYYTAFPAASFELGNLYNLVILDPNLRPSTRAIGLRVIGEMVKKLPHDPSLDIPTDCNTPLDQAGLSPERRAQLTSDWCDFSAFVKHYRP